jgi:hypothetical protein
LILSKITNNELASNYKARIICTSLTRPSNPTVGLEIYETDTLNNYTWNGSGLKRIDTWKVKASQYNHIEDKFNKKDLNDRWNDFDEFKIQRDLYSAFLIMNVNNDLKTINKDLCIEKFNRFKELHDIEIERLRNMKLSQALMNVM